MPQDQTPLHPLLNCDSYVELDIPPKAYHSLPPFPDGGNDNKFEISLPIQYIGVGLLAFYLYSTLGEGSNANRVHEISFQEFKTKLLGQVIYIKYNISHLARQFIHILP